MKVILSLFLAPLAVSCYPPKVPERVYGPGDAFVDEQMWLDIMRLDSIRDDSLIIPAEKRPKNR